jgi:peptidoglycan glycosyltransferase
MNTYMYDLVVMSMAASNTVRWVLLTMGMLATPAFAQDADEGDAFRPKVDMETAGLRGMHYFADLQGGGLAQLTLDPVLQQQTEESLAAHHFPFAAAAAISIPDGRVLVLAGYSAVDPSLDAADLALRPWAPAASVFKVVSAASLLQDGRIDPESKVCYHGGVSSIVRDNLIDIPAIDHSCATLGYGIGKSQNAIIAKLATRHLHPAQLAHMAAAFGFGRTLDFDAEMEASEIDVPRDSLEFARAAAGFWHSSLSPLHGALVAATIANHGEMPPMHVIARAVSPAGSTVVGPRRVARRVVDPSVAEQLGRMMQLTTTMGTARHSFRDGKGHPTLPIEVAGKTGTLFYRGRPTDPALPVAAPIPEVGRIGYSWFVGFAPADHPTVAFAVLLGNPVTAMVRAHSVARNLLAGYVAAGGAGKHDGFLAHR